MGTLPSQSRRLVHARRSCAIGYIHVLIGALGQRLPSYQLRWFFFLLFLMPSRSHARKKKDLGNIVTLRLRMSQRGDVTARGIFFFLKKGKQKGSDVWFDIGRCLLTGGKPCVHVDETSQIGSRSWDQQGKQTGGPRTDFGTFSLEKSQGRRHFKKKTQVCYSKILFPNVIPKWPFESCGQRDCISMYAD